MSFQKFEDVYLFIRDAPNAMLRCQDPAVCLATMLLILKMPGAIGLSALKCSLYHVFSSDIVEETVVINYV